MLTLQPRYFSSAALATYVLAVEPAHACSLSVTVPQLALVLAPAVPTTSTPVAAIAPAAGATAIQRPLTRSFIRASSSFALGLLPCAHPALGDAVERDAEREDRD